MKAWIAVGAISMALAVGLGAFGTHALRDSFDERQLAWWGTAQQYHAVHSLGLVAIAMAAVGAPQAGKWPARLIFVGIALFSGSLYTMALTKMTWLGAVTPFGGACLIGGWTWLGFAILNERKMKA